MEAQREAFLHCRGKNPVALLRRHETQHGGSAQALKQDVQQQHFKTT